MNARPDAWLRQAQNDLELAQLARDNGYLAQACFYASQAAEKGLKSALLELGLEPPHTHVLNDLTRRLTVKRVARLNSKTKSQCELHPGLAQNP